MTSETYMQVANVTKVPRGKAGLTNDIPELKDIVALTYKVDIRPSHQLE
jgi:hypothetical protein